VNHLKCAAFELPLAPEERFGNVELPELCERLAEAGYCSGAEATGTGFRRAIPADTISLRSVTSDNFVIIDTTGEDDGEPEVIGEVDFSSALTPFIPRRSTFIRGSSTTSSGLISASAKAYVKRVNVDYFTDAIRYTQVRVLEIAEEQSISGRQRGLMATCSCARRSSFKKIKFFTNENVGSGKLELPENEMPPLRSG